MNYARRRIKKKLDRYTVSKKVGVSYDFYCDVEKGLKSLSGEQVVKFLNVLKNAKQLKLEKINILNDMRDFYELDNNKMSMAKRKLKEFKMSQSDLANKMNVTAPVICKLLKDFTKTSYELAYMTYDYLNGYNQEPKLDTTVQDKEEKIEINSTVEDIKNEVDRVMSKPINEVVYDGALNIQDFNYNDYNKTIMMSSEENEPKVEPIDYSNNLKMSMLEFENKMLKQKLEMISKIINM